MTPERAQELTRRLKRRMYEQVGDFFVDNSLVRADLTDDGKLTFTCEGQTWLVVLQPRS